MTQGGAIPRCSSGPDSQHEVLEFQHAARIGDIAGVALSLARGVDVNAVDIIGYTALHWAVERGQESMVRLLLQHGALTTIRSLCGRTPVWYAAAFGNARVLRMVLSKDESSSMTNEADVYGETALVSA